MLKILGAERDVARVVAPCNSPQIHWPDIHPGTLVDWRESANSHWVRVWVNMVIHEHDGEKVYTIVMVALLDGQGLRKLGTRTVTGEAIATCIRAPL
jgi:hypothetical protein